MSRNKTARNVGTPSSLFFGCCTALLLVIPALAGIDTEADMLKNTTQTQIIAHQGVLLAGRGPGHRHGPGDGSGNGGIGPGDGSGNGPGDCAAGLVEFSINQVLLARGGNGGGGNGGGGNGGSGNSGSGENGGHRPGNGTGNDGAGPADGTGFGPGDCTLG